MKDKKILILISNKYQQVNCKNMEFRRSTLPKWSCGSRNLTKNLSIKNPNVTCDYVPGTTNGSIILGNIL